MFGQLSALQILKESNIDLDSLNFNFDDIQKFNKVSLIFENKFEEEIIGKYLNLSESSVENILELSKLIENRINITRSLDQDLIIDLFKNCIK